MKKGVFVGVTFMVVLVLGVSLANGADLTIPTAGRVTVEAIYSDAAYRNTLSIISPAVDLAFTGCNLEPAVLLPGTWVLSEKVSQRGCRVDLDADPGTPGIQGFAANTTFEFGMCAQTDADDDCEFVWSSNPNNNYDSYDHVQTTELYPVGFPGQVFQLNWEDLPNGGDQDFNDLIVVVRVQSDSDGDGLWDDWEQFGIDTNADGIIDLDLPALGANPNQPDIFIEIDFMDCNIAGGDCAAGDTHNHRPKTDTINAVVDAFADAGITLHVDVDDAIPHQNQLSPGCFSGPGIGNFDDVKADPAFFGASNPRRFAYHYVIFGHRQGDSTSSGCAEVAGNDFMVSLGEWNTGCVYPGANGTLETVPALNDLQVGEAIYSGPDLVCNTTAAPGTDDIQAVGNGNPPPWDLDGDLIDDRTVGTVQQQAGTLMHEFGHNLNLRHGGDVSLPNYKPNYLSIMNYTFQLRGIPPNDPDGLGPLTARIDYSWDDLDDLDENHLDETVGINDGTDRTIYRCPAGGWAFGSGTGAIDWNCDGDGGTDTNVAVNINGDTDSVFHLPLFSTLTGFDDWGNLKLDFQNTAGFEDGVHITLSEIVEMDYLTYLEIPERTQIDIKPFSDPNSINTKSKGVVPVAICNGGPVRNTIDISDSADPFGFTGVSTNLDLDTLRFALGSNGNPLGATVAYPAHDLSDPQILGAHFTDFIDTDSDGVPDTLIPLDAPNCQGDPAGPDMVVHFPTRDTGLTKGVTEACINAKLIDGTNIIGCDSVNIVK